MKLKSITIQGMHGVDVETYNFDNLTYLVGPNGAGKSTILEAIQLALLGYIPGYSKTNESIMKHSSSPLLCVTAELDNNGEAVKIIRTWQGTSSVRGSITTQPEGFDIESAISNLELPIFNFNEFKNMTANKLKEWFIDFLPAVSGEIDWTQELKSVIAERHLPDDPDKLINEVFESSNLSDAESAIDQIRAINAACKELQTYYKGQVANCEGTLKTLIYNDDCEVLDEDEVKEQLASLQAEKLKWIEDQRVRTQRATLEKQLAELDRIEENLTTNSSEELISRLQKIKVEIAELQAKQAEHQQALRIQQSLIEYNSGVTATKCPFTSKECKDLESIVQESNAKIAQARACIDEINAELKPITVELSKLNQEKGTIELNLNTLQCNDSKKQVLECQLAALPEVSDWCIDADIDARIQEANTLLGKIAANKRYNELQQSVTASKFEAEANLEMLKLWAKHTDANGMQNDVMNKPFADLATEITKYLQPIFGDHVEASFRLTNKANSFAFGLMNTNTNSFIEFDYLSSGERCMYTLAMMMCIINLSDSALKLIMIDDILDHLDDINADKLFNILAQSTDIQFILAGVKPCNLKDICVEVN